MVLLMGLPFPVLWEGKQRDVTYHVGASGFLYPGLLRLLCPLTLCDYVFVISCNYRYVVGCCGCYQDMLLFIIVLLILKNLLFMPIKLILSVKFISRRSQWSRGLRRGSAAARLLGLRFRISPGAWMSAPSERCVLSGRGLWDGPITCPEGSLPSVVCLSVIAQPQQ